MPLERDGANMTTTNCSPRGWYCLVVLLAENEVSIGREVCQIPKKSFPVFENLDKLIAMVLQAAKATIGQKISA